MEPHAHPAARKGTEPLHFFDLTIPEHAYLFGLLHADGHHAQGTRNRGKVTLHLQVGDIDMLRKLQAIVPWYSSVTTRVGDTNFKKDYESATWSLCSWDARIELEKLGLLPGRKAHRVAPPAGSFSQRDFMRGLFDGDGSVGTTASNLPFVSFVTQSEPMAEFVESYCFGVSGGRRTLKRNKRDNIFNLAWIGSTGFELAANLWQDGDLCLERKMTSAKKAAAWQRPEGMRSRSYPKRWTPEEDEILMACATSEEAATALNRTMKSVAIRKHRLKNPDRNWT